MQTKTLFSSDQALANSAQSHPDDKTLSNSEIKTLGLSSLGGMLEFYDFIIFTFFARYFSQHFFPASLGENWQLLNTYGAFAAGYLARPLGGIVMAHFGDKFGRKNMFMLSIILMVIPTLALAITPTYETIGYGAPVILLLVRVFQGIAIGGELPGAWVFVREHSPEQSKGAYMGLLTSSVVGGIFLGSIVTLFMQLRFSAEELGDWAWRLPFALGGIFGLISVYLRRFLQETPVFKKMQQERQIAQFPLKSVLANEKRGVIISFFITWVLTACVLIFLLLMPVLSAKTLGISPVQSTLLQMAGILLVMLGCICSGSLSDHFGIAAICKIFAFFWAVFAVFYFYEIYFEKTPMLVAAAYLPACFFAGVMNFTPLIMCEVFSPAVRFSGLSFAYNIAYAAAGFITPILIPALHLQASGANPAAYAQLGGAIYVIAMAVVAYGCAAAFKSVNKSNAASCEQLAK